MKVCYNSSMNRLKEECKETTIANFGYDASDDILIFLRSASGKTERIDWDLVDRLIERYGERIDANYELEWEDGDLDIDVSDELYDEVIQMPEFLITKLRLV